MSVDTYFAPVRRTDRREFKNQIVDISHSPLMNTLLKAVSGLMVVLNEDRQIVAINHAFLEAIGIHNAEEVLGLRLGESLKCVHAHGEPNGCGTTLQCVTCGAAIATMAAIENDAADEQMCAMTTEQDGVKSDICLLIRSHPMRVDDRRWILLFAQDITQEQFWMNLERIFFHDINNSLASLLGYSDLLASEMPDHPAVQQIRAAAVRLNAEVSLQRTLSKNKEGQYEPNRDYVPLSRIKKELGLLVDGHTARIGKSYEADWPEPDVSLYTDPLLVSKVLGNMVINALEATPKGGQVRLAVEVVEEGTAVVWKVWNAAYIDDKYRHRIFQRYFSTKADSGRGLGTYAMKLFGEHYLGGKVDFVSDPAEGTVFFFRLPINRPS